MILLVILGCSEDKFLDEVNPNAITEGTFWGSEKQFNSALTTVYGALQFQAVSGGDMAYEFNRGDIGGTEPWYRPLVFKNFTYNDGTYYVVDKWNEMYMGIFRANQVIQKLEEAGDNIVFNTSSKEEVLAQARFLRAYFYFEIINNYGQAIIHTTVPEPDELSKPLSTIEEVTNSVIIPDLTYAKSNLPTKWEGEDLGRVTWGAATALLGKVHLYGEKWEDASDLFLEVINSDIYKLTPNVLDNFTDVNEYNRESIFEVPYSAELSPGVNGNNVDDTPFSTGAEASTLGREVGQLSFGAFNTVLASYYLHEMFIYEEIDTDNPVNDGNTQSKRYIATLAPSDGEGLYYNLPFGDKPGWGFGQTAYVKKHANWYHLDAEDANSRSGINFRHIRLADVYLMYAEAVINATGDYTTAIEYIDKIRTRAGVITLQRYMDENGGMIPELYKSIQVHGPRTWVTADATSVMTHIRRVERPLELCFEGHRWKDLIRWGIVSEVFSELAADEAWRLEKLEEDLDALEIDPNAETVIVGQPPLFIVERIRPDFTAGNEAYNPSQHDYFPIPAAELQTNNELN